MSDWKTVNEAVKAAERQAYGKLNMVVDQNGDWVYEDELEEAVTVQEKRGPGRPRKDANAPVVTSPPARQPKVVNDAQAAILDLLTTGVAEKTKQAINESAAESIATLQNYLDILKQEIKDHKRITVDRDGKAIVVKGKTHQSFEKLVRALNTNFPIMLVGTAGSGKTFSAEQAAEALGITFYAVSVGTQTSKSDLLGYMNASGGYVRTAFREAYEHGGLFLIDEIDAGNSNVLIVLNAALAGQFCAFPDGMVTRHKDFKCVAAGNTYGSGASRTYVGRNQLDAATLDRFMLMDWPVDEDLENSLVSGYTDGSRWHKVIKALRQHVNDRDMKVVVSPRAALKGAQLLANGFSFEDTLSMSVLANAPKDHMETLHKLAKDTWTR